MDAIKDKILQCSICKKEVAISNFTAETIEKETDYQARFTMDYEPYWICSDCGEKECAVQEKLRAELKEIGKKDFCTVEVEDYEGNSQVAYLLNLKDGVIEKKVEMAIGYDADKFDVLKDIKSENLSSILNIEGFEVADIDEDNIFYTECLIRIQEE